MSARRAQWLIPILSFPLIFLAWQLGIWLLDTLMLTQFGASEPTFPFNAAGLRLALRVSFSALPAAFLLVWWLVRKRQLPFKRYLVHCLIGGVIAGFLCEVLVVGWFNLEVFRRLPPGHLDTTPMAWLRAWMEDTIIASAFLWPILLFCSILLGLSIGMLVRRFVTFHDNELE